MLRSRLDAEASSRFEFVRSLGKGGFGAVYEAIDRRSGQRVAVKQLDNTTGNSIARFKHEFRALSDCHHPNLVGLKELIEQDGRWLIVMELVPGLELLDYVRGGATPENDGTVSFDEGRLRSALSGIVEGLAALHGFGIVHRDLKPGNVRVRPDGRAVLLDFGLATRLDAIRESSEGIMGTVRYMAPEQASGELLGPAADVYALGTCLFEALTGRTPFEGERAHEILRTKQECEAPRASALCPSVPRDLDELCARMLAIDPAARPALDDVLHVLGGGQTQSAAYAHLATGVEDVFAGRDRELEHLERALEATRRNELRIVLVEGESGVGKSELVAEFLRRAAVNAPNLTALRGRCYENEQVSYKAFDGCIDELAKLLSQLPDHESASLLPLRAALLAQLFPVLRNIRPIARAPRDGVSADPTARRLEAFAAVSGLLQNLAEERPLVLVVDDLQWADAESFRLLAALVEQPTPPPLLLVATIRPREELEPDVLAQVNHVRSLHNTDIVQVFGLPHAQARALAATLLGPDAPESLLDTIAEESHGHPMFLGELVEYTRRDDRASRKRLTLDAALKARVSRLEQRPRELLELAALAARPHGSQLFARALEVDDVDEATRTLLAAKLLRLRKGQELGCYHDRIRNAVTELIPRARGVALHRVLAITLAASPDADPVEQARHWDLAGDRERAIAAYQAAATKAIETLAFTRAAQLCARAIELIGTHVDERRQQLLVQRAHALASMGQSSEAAALYERAADGADGEARIRLRSRAAQQLMLTGNVSQGFAKARALLIELGVSVPIGPLRSLLRFAWDRFCLTLRDKLLPHKQKLETLGARAGLAVEVIDELIHGFWLAHPLSMLTLTTQQQRLTKGDPSTERKAIIDTTNGWLLTVSGKRERALPLFERARVLLKGSESYYDMGMQAYLEGSARIAGFDWERGSVCLLHAQQLVQEHCPEWPWLITNIRYHLGVAWFHMGEHARIASQIGGWLAEARERNNALGVALLTGMGHGFARHLLLDAPEAALIEREQALATVSPEPFSFIHFGHFMSKCLTLFYESGPAALRYIENFDAEHAHEPFLKLRMPREAVLGFRLHARLHACIGSSEDERREHLRVAKTLTATLERGAPLLKGYARLALAQIHALEGRREVALEQARSVRKHLENLGHSSHRAALFLEGLLEGKETGLAKQRLAIEHYERQGWRVPLRGLAMGLPLMPLLLAAEGARRDVRAQLLLERYEVIGPLDARRGSLALARDVHTGRSLALRELERGSSEALERFKQEFRALRGLHHAHIARLDALFAHAGRWYITMELVPGSDLVSYARESGRCDATRLTQAALGAARGLIALHQAGFVHRDVTPATIRVTAEGRAVLQEFALIARAGDEDDDSPVGSPEYAAPEQQKGALPEPAADVYALGACLHEALYGRPPGARAESLREGMLLASELEPLAELCTRMLAVEPSVRPRLARVIDELDELDGRRPSTPGFDSEIVPELDERLFFGREQELARLQAAFESSDEGFTLALIEGESGLGKSALMSEFAAQLQKRWPSLRVLDGRCYESELLAFKAFDGAIARLAELLRSLPNPRCEALLPKRAALLAQLFPVLGGVPAIAAASRKGLPADPAAQKLAARECLLDLLENLSSEHELLFVIDDLQWADDESFALLDALCARRERLPMFFVCTVQSTQELPDGVAEALARLREAPYGEVIELGGLSEAAATELTLRYLGADEANPRVQALARECRGHPLFLRALIAHEASGGDGTVTRVHTLDGALRAHIARLPATARDVLSLLALAGRPVTCHTCAAALQLSELPREAVIVLLTKSLARQRGHDQLACSHNRIREVVLGMLTPDKRKQLTEDLASALELTRGAEPAERARLWDEANEPVRASDAYEQAGDRALEGLAFARAEQHYARALALLEQASASDERVRRVLEQRGHALVRAGKSADGARMFQLAADKAHGEAKVRLRIWAAQHLIQSAQIDDGLRAASDLLAELGLSLPESERAAQLRIGIERARLRMRGTRLSQRASSPRQRLILDALHGLGPSVRALRYLPGSALGAQYLRRALTAGEPLHAARALAFEALLRTIGAPNHDQSALFAESRALAEIAGEPSVLAEIALAQGQAELARGQFTLAEASLKSAHELVQTSCPGQPWLLTSVRMYLGATWLYAGDHSALVRCARPWFDEALTRDDRYARALLAGFGAASYVHLVNDQPELALTELSEVMAPWPEEPFSTSHFGAFAMLGAVQQYRGGRALLDWLDQGRARRERAHLMRTPICRVAEHTLGMLGVARALECASAQEKPALLERAAQHVRALEQTPAPAALAFAAMCRGLLQALSGAREPAQQTLAKAAAQLATLGSTWAPGARYLEGLLEGGESGRAKQRALRELIARQGFQNPERALELRVPGLKLLS